jgi:hypothetical protein
MVKEKLISDIELRLAGGEISDDRRVPRRQISHWLDIVRDRLVQDELNKSLSDGDSILGSYLEPPDEALEIEQDDAAHLDDPRYYVTLTKTPLTIQGDRGIVKVLTSDLEPVLKTNIAEVDIVKRLHYAKPTINNPLYWRRGNRLYLEGVSSRIKNDYTIDVYYVVSYGNNSPEEDEDFKISDQLVPLLLDLVEETARREYQIPPDIENDGQ